MADTVDPDPPPPPMEVVVTPTAIPVQEPPPPEGCMSKRSCLEKCLIIIVIIIIIICLAALCAFLVYYFFASPPEGTCLTDSCVKSASRLKSYMDDSVDPCNNFYKYACGGWAKDKILDAKETHIDMMTMITASTLIKLKTIIEEPIHRDDPDYTKDPRTFYTSCMNMDLRNSRGADPFLGAAKVIGKFPAIDSSWNETDFDFESMMIQLNRLQTSPFFHVEVNPDIKNRDINRLYIGPAQTNPIFMFDADHGKEDNFITEGRDSEKVKFYESKLAEMLGLLGAGPMEAEEDAEAVVDFEFSLTQIVSSGDEDGSNLVKVNNPMTIAMLQSKYPWLNWLEFFQGLTTNPDGGVGVYIGIEEVVINRLPSYFEKLGPLLNKTSKRVLTNYMMTRMSKLIGFLGQDFEDLSHSLSQKLFDSKVKPPWEECVHLTAGTFGLSVGRMYVDKYFSKEAKNYMTEMIKDLKTAFQNQLTTNEWMSGEAKKKATRKLDAMRSKIGFPDMIFEDEKLNRFYDEISSNQKTFFENVISHEKFRLNYKIKSLREGTDKNEWTVIPTSVKAFNNRMANEIVFPAAFLQEPAFSSEYSSSMNYGGVGSIIGHDITHGFDTEGSDYDENGGRESWWSERDLESFESRSECFIDQYGCYKWDGLSMDGEKTAAENIADNGGLKQSYTAYRNMIERRGSEEPRLPGLDLDHNQVFFLSFAQVWCAKYQEEIKEEIIAHESNTPKPYRVYGTLQNSQEFADAFKCPLGSRMNPLQKCILW